MAPKKVTKKSKQPNPVEKGEPKPRYDMLYVRDGVVFVPTETAMGIQMTNGATYLMQAINPSEIKFDPFYLIEVPSKTTGKDIDLYNTISTLMQVMDTCSRQLANLVKVQTTSEVK